MSFKYLDLSGLEDLWINIKNYILSKIPTKTSELTNDSGYLTSHQSLDNYVTLNTDQTITAIKTITGGNQGKMLFKNPNYTKGDAVESGIVVSRLYFGNGTSYATANGILTFDITSSGNTSLELAALNNTASSSYRASLIITYDKSATRPRLLKSWGDFIPNSNDEYSLGNVSNVWKECYSNAYYLGSTAFGDIVTHLDSEYVHKTGDETIAGTKTFSSTISGSISGNAGTATQFSANTTVALTGDATGTSAGSKKGWSVPVTLANSGVTAGTYGPSADVTGSNNATILVPEITVDAKGRVTAVNNRTYTSVNTDSDKKVYQYYKSDDNVYRLLFSNNAGNTATSNVGAVYSGLNNSFYVNPSTGSLYATKLYSNGVEVLTSHQSLSSCVKNVVTNNQTIKSTGITRGTAPSSAQTFGLGFSDNNNKYIGNVYGQYATDMSTYVGLYAYKGSTTTNGDNASVRVGYDASGNAYTYAPTPATADNSTQIATTAFVKAQGYLTSHQSLANYVTLNTDQTISAIKSHSKHISILGDYIGNESSTNGRSCLYLKANRDTDGKSGLYVTKFRQSVAQGSMGSSDVVFLSHDILENETRTNAGFVESYSNWSSDVPGGMSIYSSIATRNLGTSAKPWTNAYITNLNLNGNVFDPVSTSGNVGDIVFASAYYSSIMGTSQLGLTVSGDALYLACFDNNTLVIDSSASSLPGTWKFLGRGKPTTTSGNADTKRVGLWKRIA